MELALISVKSLLAGILLGLVFALLKLPIPAPPVFPAIMGIAGVWLGGYVLPPFVHEIMQKIF